MALTEPSRPQNAYWIWLSEHRDIIAKECGSSKGSIVGKLAGEKWKALKVDAKKPYEAKAAAAKTAYEKAMEDFRAAGGEVGKRRQEKKEAKQEKADKKAKKEARKNSGAPKRPPSAFWLWQVENRDGLIKEAGTNKIPVIGKLAGAKWGQLSDAVKAPFEKRATEAKEEYSKALAEWKASNPGADDDNGEGEDEGEAEEESSPPAKKTRKAAGAGA